MNAVNYWVPVEEQHEPVGGWFGARSQDGTGRSIHGKNSAYCFEDQTIAEAEQIMLNAKVGAVLVVTRETMLVGTINIEAVAQKKNGRKRWKPLGNPAPEGATIDTTTPPRVVNDSLKS
jgi:CBS domain-containing protein